MKAIVMTAAGDPSVLQEAEVEAPEPGPGQVRVLVQAIGVNPIEARFRAGDLPVPLPAVIGFEFAGAVDALGAGVSDVQPGDRVVGWPDGSIGAYAEQTVSGSYLRLPDALSFQDAAAVLVAADTSSRVLAELGLRPGETLLIHGAGGAVGSVATQIALARGARVIATAGPTSLQYVEGLGATAVPYVGDLVGHVRAARASMPSSMRRAREHCLRPSNCAGELAGSSPSQPPPPPASG